MKNNLKQFSIVALIYPLVAGVKASANLADDLLLMNGNYLVHTPSNIGPWLYYWPTNTAPLLDLFSPTEGLTVVAPDDTLRSTGISARGLDRKSLELSLVKVVNLPPGGTFTGAPHLLRVHQGDWHTTALTERAWLSIHRPSAVPPLWLAECDGWTMAGGPAGWWVNNDPTQQALLRLRRLTRQYLYPAPPMDTMGLKIESALGGTGGSPVSGLETIQARWFLCDPTCTRGAVVNLINNQKVEGATITVPTAAVGPIKTAWLVDATGFDGPLTGGESVDNGQAYRFPVPPAAAATVLLLGPGAEPRVTVTNETLISREGQAQVSVQIESLTGEHLRGAVCAAALSERAPADNRGKPVRKCGRGGIYPTPSAGNCTLL